MKKLIALLMALTMLFSLCACGTSAVPASSPDSTPEPTSEPTPDPNAPYAERYGIEFPEEYTFPIHENDNGEKTQETSYILSAPYFACLETAEGEYIPNSDTESFTAGDALYSFDSISISPSQQEGMAELKIEMKVSPDGPGAEYLHDESTGNGNWVFYQWVDPCFFDYYSGYTFTNRTLSGDDSFEISTVFEYMDKTYEISFKSELIIDSHWVGGHILHDRVWNDTLWWDATHTYTFIIPEDYDGLCLALRRDAYGDDYEYEDLDTETYSESELWLDSLRDDDDPSKDTRPEDYYLVRVSDLMAAMERVKNTAA